MIKGKCYCCKKKATMYVVAGGKKVPVCNDCRHLYKTATRG